MSAEHSVNRRIVLARRPQGAPSAQDFRLEAQPVPVPGAGQVLLRTRYLSLDPYMRGRMNEARSYAAPVAIGAPMVGQTVSVVQASNLSGFTAGDLVLANVGWQDYGLSDGSDLVRIDAATPRPSYALGVLGMPGLTAAQSVSPAAARSASTRSRRWGSMSASITRRPSWRSGSRRPVPTASTCTSRASVARFSAPSCRCSISGRGCRCAG